MSASLGPDGWGVNSFGNGQWGDPFAFNPASIIVPTGQTLSADVGDLTISRIDMVFSYFFTWSNWYRYRYFRI